MPTMESNQQAKAMAAARSKNSKDVETKVDGTSLQSQKVHLDTAAKSSTATASLLGKLKTNQLKELQAMILADDFGKITWENIDRKANQHLTEKEFQAKYLRQIDSRYLP